MTKPIRYQTIGGIRYRICDVGVDDLEKAALNRKRIAENYAVGWWLEQEAREAEEQQEMAGVIQVRRR